MTTRPEIVGYLDERDLDVMPRDLAEHLQGEKGFPFKTPLIRLADYEALAAPAVQVEPARHEWDEQDKCRRCGDRDWYAGPICTPKQPTEQQKPLKSILALDAATHLTNWMELDWCECEGGHTCGLNEVRRTRDALLVAAEQQPAPDVAGLVEALESLIKGYVGLLEAGMDRITSLGGDCDPVPVMEQNDPWLRDARAALAALQPGPDEWKQAVDAVADYAHLYSNGLGVIHEIRAEHTRLTTAHRKGD